MFFIFNVLIYSLESSDNVVWSDAAAFRNPLQLYVLYNSQNKFINKKQGIQFVLDNYYWACVLPWNVVDKLALIPLKKTDYLSPRGCPLPIVP